MFTKLKQNVLYIVIAALVVAGGYIAWDNHRDQQAEIGRLQDDQKKKDAKIDELQGNALKDESFKESTEKVDAKTQESIQQAQKDVSEAKKYVDKKLAEIDKRYSKLPKDEETQRAKTIEISLERARGLWAVYCIQIPQDPACK